MITLLLAVALEVGGMSQGETVAIAGSAAAIIVATKKRRKPKPPDLESMRTPSELAPPK